MSAPAAPPSPREIWRIEGPDAVSFLQGLVTNDILPLSRAPGIVWAALLSPQGKYLADFFVLRRAEDPATRLHIDIAAGLAAATRRLLTLYKLRADVAIADSDLRLSRGAGTPPAGAFADPRHEALGWRLYTPGDDAGRQEALPDEDLIRVAELIPAWPAELRPNESYILEQGFERLHGVDFRKGCYVGQEVTARMKHKTELRKGLVRLNVREGDAPPGTAITLTDGREAGIVGTRAGDRVLAYMRFDRLSGPLQAGGMQLAAEEAPLPEGE